MPTVNLSNGDVISILIVSSGGSSVDYIKKGLPDPAPTSFHRQPGGADVTAFTTVELYDVTATDSYKDSPSSYVEDANLNQWPQIIGGRPSNIIRR